MSQFLTLMFVLAGAVVAGELGARWWIRHRTHYYVWPPGLRIKMLLDRDTLPTLPTTTRFYVNKDGERGAEVPKMGGLYRVLVAGGSQPEGSFLDQDTTWPGVLQSVLERPRNLRILGASGVHVGCIARSGVGSEALNLIFEKMLPRYRHLELIVVMVGVSDVMRWFEQNTPAKLQPVRVNDVFRSHPEGRFGWAPRRLAILELLRRARRRWLRPVDVHERSGHWLSGARAMRAKAAMVRDTTPDPTPMLTHFERHFRQALERAREHADRVLVIKQPWFRRPYNAEEAAHMWHGGIGQAWREEITTFYSFEAFNRVMEMVDERAGEVAAGAGVETLDLTDSLDQGLDTYYDGFHLTPKGARQVAAAVSAAIVGIESRSSAPFTPAVVDDAATHHARETATA